MSQQEFFDDRGQLSDLLRDTESKGQRITYQDLYNSGVALIDFYHKYVPDRFEGDTLKLDQETNLAMVKMEASPSPALQIVLIQGRAINKFVFFQRKGRKRFSARYEELYQSAASDEEEASIVRHSTIGFYKKRDLIIRLRDRLRDHFLRYRS